MTTYATRPNGLHRPRPCTLVVCRGCCCGDPRKNPGTDHEGQLARLREAATTSGGRLAVRTSDCLGPCGQANVIVVQPSTEARRRGARAAWIGWALDDDATDDVLEWVAAGGPGVAEPPATLALQMIPPPSDARRRAR
ncbi:(2Fe-2S) ferredoxin domain-containing protein [Streptomyces sp. NBC_00322]|uniref:(2Fe-2S) ferredoxin domain-containing protein n=1 Tax=Streptomyces sp. NBC_00322 TaxID=2975712 RepID=UPI002E2C95F7|nr:(2Fe-2S) ferredoxin domain-containing protein [Streptomyces sp. NBC_00322]